MGAVIAWLIIGAIAGGLASFIVPGRTPGGRVGAVAIGILGGLLGGWILDLLGAGSDLNWLGSVVVATAGAVGILYVLRSREQRA